MSELSGSPGSEGYEVCDDEGQEPTRVERLPQKSEIRGYYTHFTVRRLPCEPFSR